MTCRLVLAFGRMPRLLPRRPPHSAGGVSSGKLPYPRASDPRDSQAEAILFYDLDFDGLGCHHGIF